ncbi:hypothetical protein IHN63_00610 [Deinococcus sp. 6YEL10]|uniref:hypothetical protein n=1 Tax=Deinococcus sp. 6YEL10 TaxID=2745870 RepID=UPI001E2D10A4|nr:hypothetical protein [Deinococcus sp. 6YEL10]MCD0159801.1 hypothetical protein [Deinococcus sp. 6YEL10]
MRRLLNWLRRRRRPAAHPLPYAEQMARAAARCAAPASPLHREKLPWLVRNGGLNRFAIPQLLAAFHGAYPDGHRQPLDTRPESYLGGSCNVPAGVVVMFSVVKTTTPASLVAYTADHVHWFDRAVFFTQPSAILAGGESFMGASNASSLLRMLAADVRAEQGWEPDTKLYAYEYGYTDTDVAGEFRWTLRAEVPSDLINPAAP